MDQELIALNLISNSGVARTKAFEALSKARKGEFNEAKSLLKEAEESSLLAHKAQTELLQAEANGEKLDYSIIMVHAQDHLMTTMTLLEVAQEMNYLYQKNK